MKSLVRDRFVIDHKLYWAAPTSESETLYLAAILNSESVRSRTAALQSRGQWGARDFDKVVFTLPIPRFDGAAALHTELAAAASEAERAAAAVSLPENAKFRRARGLIRTALIEAGIAPRIEAMVARVIDG